MKVEVTWKNHKINQNYIVIAPGYKQTKEPDTLDDGNHRNSSTELFSYIYNLVIPSENLQLKTLMTNGSIQSDEDLTKLIQSNLKISWIIQDKYLDVFRQGCANLTWCYCPFSQSIHPYSMHNNPTIGHEFLFSTNDLIRIWLSDNVHLEMAFSTDDDSSSPTLPDSSGIKINTFEGVVYKITCKFKDPWPSFLLQDAISNIKLLPYVVSMKNAARSISSPEWEESNFKHFDFAGNTVSFLQQASIPSTEINGFIMFLQHGSYTISSHLTSSNTNWHRWQSDILVLAESEKYQIHVI